MRYYRNIDYFIYFCDFPHMGVPGVIAANTDGTVNIYINTLYTPERQDHAIRHELRHLVKNHFWCDTKTIEEKELEADTEDSSVIFSDDYSSVEYLPPVPSEKNDDARKPVKERPLPDVFFDPPPPGKIAYFDSLDAMKRYMIAMLRQRREQAEALQKQQ